MIYVVITDDRLSYPKSESFSDRGEAIAFAESRCRELDRYGELEEHTDFDYCEYVGVLSRGDGSITVLGCELDACCS